MVAPTQGSSVVKAPQYVEEAVEGTTPTASPAFNWIGANINVNPQTDMDDQEIYTVAHEDATFLLKGQEADVLELDYHLQNSTFLKYGVNAQGGGTGSIDKSLSILWSQLQGGAQGAEYVTFIRGARFNSVKIKGTVGKPIEVDAEIYGHQIPAPIALASDGLTTPTFATDPATAPWNFTDGGVGPITVGGAALDITDIEVDINRNLERLYVMGSSQATYIPPRNRTITGTMTVVYEASTDITSLLAVTEASLAWTLKSSSSILTLTNMSFRKLTSLEIKPDAITYEKWSFGARGASLT